MQLCYSIVYYSSHPFYKSFISTLMQQCGIQGEVLQTREKIYLFLDDSEEKINALFKLFESELPISIYMGAHQVEESCDKDTLQLLPESRSDELFLTPSSIMELSSPESQHYFKPHGEDVNYTFSDGEKVDDLQVAFGRMLEFLKSGKSVGLQSTFGSHVFSLCGGDRYKALMKKGIEPDLFVIEPDSLAPFFEMTEKQIHALFAMERPKVRLFFKENSNYSDLSDIPTIRVCVPFDPLSLLFAKSCSDTQIPYLYVYTSDSSDLMLSDGKESLTSELEVVPMVDRTLLLSGQRSVLPKKLDIQMEDVLSVANGVGCTVGEAGGAQLDSLERLQVTAVEKVRVMEGNALKIEHGNLESFKDFQGACLSVRAEHGILGQPSAGAYLSLQSKSSCFLACQAGQIPQPVMHFDSIPGSFQEIFAQVAAIDENSPRLIENFKNRFPETYLRLQGIDFGGKSSLETLEEFFAVCGLCMGFDLPLQRMYWMLVTQAHYFSQEGSVKLDMYVKPHEKSFVFDWAKTVRSILSFRMADVEKDVLAYAVFESFSDFINDNLSDICKKLGVQNAALCGDLFANDILTKRVIKHSTHIYQPLFNRQLPIDDINIALGGAYA